MRLDALGNATGGYWGGVWVWTGAVVNGQPVADVVATGGAPKWLSAGRTLIYLRMQDLVLGTVEIESKALAIVLPPRGCTELAAGDGVYAAWDGRFGLFGNSLPSNLPAGAGLADVSRQGVVAYAPDRNQYGVALWPSDVLMLDANASTFRLCDADRGVWVDGGQLHYYGLTDPGIRQATPVAVAVLVMVYQEPWVIYSTNDGVLARPFHSPQGYVVYDTPTAFNHDAVWLESIGRLRIGSCLGPGEFPNELQIVDLDLSLPRVDVTRFQAPPEPEPPKPRPDVFDMRVWGFFGTRNAFPRNDGGSVYDYQPYGASGYVVVKFGDPAKRTFFDEQDGVIWLRQDFTAPESVLKHGYALTNGRWFPRQWDLTPFDVTNNEELVFGEHGEIVSRRHWPYRRRAEYLPSFDFGGDIGVQPCLKVYRDSSPFTGNPRDFEISYLTEQFGDTAWEDNNGGRVIWNRIGGQRIEPLPPLPIPDEPTPDPTPPDPEEPDDMEPKRIALRIGKYFARIDPAESGQGPFQWFPVRFDRESPDDPNCVFEQTKPDAKLAIKHVTSSALLGADATEFGADICRQFYGKPNDDRGAYESWNGWRLGQNGTPIVLVEYNRDGERYTSACLTVVEL